MIYAFDTFYTEQGAKTVCIGFEAWADKAFSFYTEDLRTEVAAYESGAFFKRELPCVLQLIATKLTLKKGDILVVDGFTVLDDSGKKGLGSYLFDSLGGQYPVIGVAKNDFKRLSVFKRAVLRGGSQKPIFVTAVGYDLAKAAAEVASMDGSFRLPTLLKQLDQLSRL